MYLNDRILAVDDNPDNLLILDELLGDDYTLLCVASGEEALAKAPAFRPDIILLDIMMPGMDGFDACVRLSALPELRTCRIVMLSAKNQLSDRLLSYSFGAVDYLTKPFDHHEIRSKIRIWMQMIRQREVEAIWREAEAAELAVGDAMVNVASFRDTETADHLFRVRWYAQNIAEFLSVSGPYTDLIDDRFLEHLYHATPLHDLGKVAIHDAILRKPGPLTSEEFEVMKTHTIVGSQLLRRAAERLPHARYLEMAAMIARHHHEWFDGSGYPDGLSRLEIPLAARICTVADVFDAITSPRVYKPAVSITKAIDIVLEGNGTQFDPAVIEAFQTRLDDIHVAYSRFHGVHGADPSDTTQPWLGLRESGLSLQHMAK